MHLPRWSNERMLMLLLVVSMLLNAAFVLRPKVATKLSRPPLWAVGTIAPPIGLDDAAGNRKWFEWDKRKEPTVLYLFSPRCRWCDYNLPNLKQLIAAQAAGFVVLPVGLGPDSAKQAILATPLGGPVYTISSQTLMMGYSFGGTPQTLVIGEKGRVLGNWRGAYDASMKADIEAKLQAKVFSADKR